MSDASSPSIDSELASLGVVNAPVDEHTLAIRRRETESRVAEISSLLSALEEAAADTRKAPRAPAPQARPVDNHENRLVQVRLGLASGLFTALQHKHPPTASHSLRVALGCSTWALYKRLDDETRDAIEAASLLHDVGKISVPDAVLTKSTPLTPEEEAMLQTHWEAGVHILACCCS